MLPNFNRDGNLPPGTHEANWSEIEKRYGYTTHRRKLLEGLHRGIRDLQSCGCKLIYLDGSFVTSKPVPGDFDVCYVPDFDLDKLENNFPVFFDFFDSRKKQKEVYQGEFFPSGFPLDRLGKYTILQGFQMDKYTNKAKGIVTIKL